MRAPLLVGVLTVALAATACSSAPDPSPLPSSTADGLITEITNPEAPFEVAWTLAMGDDGSALVVFIEPGAGTETGVPPAGLALVYRDGTCDTIVELSDERFAGEWPTSGEISESTVAWIAHIGEGGTAIHFWDRDSKQVTDGAATLTEGDLAGMKVEPWTLDNVLVGDVFFGIQSNFEADDPPNVMVAATGDGRAKIVIDDDREWVWYGKDECASTLDRPVLWAVERIIDPEGEAPSLVSWQLDATDPYELTAIEGSDLSLDPWYDELSILLSIRCGDDILGASRDETLDDGNNSRPFAILTPGDTPSIEYLDAYGQGGSLVGSALTPQWILLGGSPLDLSPHVIINRTSGASATLPVGDSSCTSIDIQGDYVSWQVPTSDSHSVKSPAVASCDTLIGVLTEPEG
ncbi:MAG: hypothetical protein JW722_07120 [Demequinaceae bacterium]|nr:hypothetical protein [Demequinaceae bacterium]